MPIPQRHQYLAPTLAVLLMLTLAVTLALLLKTNHPHFTGDTPQTAPPSRTTDPSPTAEPSSTVPTTDSFPARAREQVPTLDRDLTDQQVTEEALALCADIQARGVLDVYNTREAPVQTPEDAAQFFRVAVGSKCPEHAEELANIQG